MHTVCVLGFDERLSALLCCLLRAPECAGGLSPAVSSSPIPGAALTVCPPEIRDVPPPVLRVGRGTGELPFPFLREDFFRAVRRALSEGGDLPALPPLTPKEAEIFALLSARPGVPVSRDVLLALWKDERGKAGLNVYLHRLRRKLEEDGRRRLFTVRGGGYVYEPAGKGDHHAASDPR